MAQTVFRKPLRHFLLDRQTYPAHDFAFHLTVSQSIFILKGTGKNKKNTKESVKAERKARLLL
jgi:hypothetical protein